MDPTEERFGADPAGSASSEGARVEVSSDQRLIAETIGAGLRSRGLRVSIVPWWPESPVPRPRVDDRESSGPAVLLLICDLGHRAQLDEARIRGSIRDVPWVVMTESVRGPTWGAMLEAGAGAVVSSTITLSELVESLRVIARGESPIGGVERAELVSEWRSEQVGQDRLRVRLGTLSPREQVVLSMLYEGITVRTIAERLGVSEATVRSQVKNVLRKLAVASQLAAVAVVEELRSDGSSESDER
ncbi:MAG: bvgA [Nocardioides sp.]|nr:bvgA [Nocardioides sp.]